MRTAIGGHTRRLFTSAAAVILPGREWTCEERPKLKAPITPAAAADYFYEALEKHGLLAAVIRCAQDEDANTRKFACFALGNAAFHSAALYPALRPAIGPLMACLEVTLLPDARCPCRPFRDPRRMRPSWPRLILAPTVILS